ncbi:MAG: uracil-DNA glycosylase [Clostridiales bacterium GWF2_38_85]|nr:MAG: uracil-DNA glycosylase [Clostridiales bacterium GWF2_38_85]HBL83736.1 uracil-DNA glycosylase [Clostridiales bacterium]
MVHIGNSWDELLKSEFDSEHYQELRSFLKSEYSKYNIFPPMNDIFNALRYIDYQDVKVVILGQDPYHGLGQAHGLCFSVQDGVAPPPSLLNIYKELAKDIDIHNSKTNGNLTPWAKQGVLLLNTVLTVRESSPGSHRNMGWEKITDSIIELLDRRDIPMVFLLWGAYAKSKKVLIKDNKHLILEAAHPSPLSAYNGFFGCKHFSKANTFLESTGQSPVDWSL